MRPDLTSAMCGFYLCTGICLTKQRARMPADQAKASPPHTRSVRGLLRTKRGSKPTSAMCGFYLCTGICLTKQRARMPADQTKVR